MDQYLEFINNHLYLWTGFVFAIAAVAAFELRAKITGVARLAPPDLTNKINHHDALVIDLRDKPAFKEGHIVSAENIMPSEEDKIKKKLDKAKGKPVVFVCNMGSSSGQVANKFKKQGYDQVFTLAGGITAWKNAGLPLTKS